MKNVTLGFEQKFESLKKSEDGDTLLRETLSDWLARDTGKEPIKFWSWALALHKGETISIDDSDFKKLYDWVHDHEAFTAAFKAQCLMYMNEEKQREVK